MENSNPFGRLESAVLNSQTFQEFGGDEYEEMMTIRGAVNKSAFLLMIVAVSAAWGWFSTAHGLDGVSGWLVLAIAAAFIVGWVTSANMQVAPLTAPLYAFLEGILLGSVSAIFEAEYPGIVIQAVFLTFGTLFGLLAIYHLSGYRVGHKFRTGVIAATLAILLVYFANAALQLLGLEAISFIHQGGAKGILINLFVVFLAALNLVLDFDLIEKGAQDGAPKYMEWYAAFGLMVTLIWLYLEVLKLLARLAADRDDD